MKTISRNDFVFVRTCISAKLSDFPSYLHLLPSVKFHSAYVAAQPCTHIWPHISIIHIMVVACAPDVPLQRYQVRGILGLLTAGCPCMCACDDVALPAVVSRRHFHATTWIAWVRLLACVRPFCVT